MEGLTTSQVAELLKKDGFRDDVVQLFVENEVDGEALMMLETYEDMKAVGLTKHGDRLKIKKFIQKYQEGANDHHERESNLPQTGLPVDADNSEHSIAKCVPASNVACKESIFTITFNVIVSGVCWGWDKNSELYICLSPPEFGGMESAHSLPVESFWVTTEQFFVFKGFLEISYDTIKRHTYIYYKYAARTGRTAGIVAEHIWNISSKKSVCRCIEIPFLEKKPGGVWEQWDTIVYPKEAVTPHGVKVAPEGYLEIIVQKVQQNLGSDEDTISQQITDDPENQDLADERCLLIYLLSHRDKLVQYDFSSSAGVSQMVSTVHQIFEQLHNRQVGLLSAPADRIVCTRKVWNSQRLPMVMGQWMKSIINSLMTKIEQGGVDESQTGASLLSSVAILCIANETGTLVHLSEETCVIIANLLRDSYRPKDNSWPAYSVLENHIPTPKFREVVAAALKKLAVTILQKSNEKDWRWLQVVPLYHFLSGLNTPFKQITLSAEIKWNFWKELEGPRKKQTQKSYINALMNVEDLMELDYVFAKVMLYMCPHNDLVTVLQKVDPILASKFYIWYVKNHGKEYITKARDPDVLHQHVEGLHMATFKSPDNEWRRKSTAFVKIAHEVMEAIMKELEGISENHCEIMHHITRHVLSIISLKVIKEHGDEARVNLEDLDEIDKPSKVIGIIEQWLLHEACVGHVKFGGLYLKKFDEEVRVWRVLCKDTVCPDNIKEHWTKAVEQLLEKRAKKVHDKTTLVLRSDQRKLYTPALVSETLIRLATDDLMSPSFPQNELSKRVDILADQRQSSGDVSKLLSRILIRHLEKHYQVGKKDAHKVHKEQILTIVELISWDVWPIMIKITRDQQSGLFFNMTDNVKRICESARNVLQDTCNQIVNGRIIMNDLRVIQKKKRQFLRLCTEAAIKDFNLEKWLGHFDATVKHIEKVQEFHNMLIDSRVQGYEALQEELQKASIKPMVELCSNWNDKTASADLKFTCCLTVEPCTQSILTSFYTLAKNSEIFRRKWKNKLSGSLDTCVGGFIQKQIVELVWKPTVADCWTLIGKLKDGVILLSEVNEVFGKQNMRQSCHSLVESLPSFYSEDILPDGVLVESLENSSMCSNETWIDTVCKQVEHYNVSLKCIKCAKALLTLRDNLKLKGDFSSIQVLGDEDSSRLERLSLCDVTDLFQDDIKLINEISGESEVEYLKSVVNNWTLLDWIMEEFKSVKDLQGFVDLALDTSDATDIPKIILLTNLRTVGSAIGQLLFNLPDPCGLNDLVAACSVFCRKETFDHTLLKVCSEHLGFFKKLKATQGSLERKTIDEIKTINEFGQIIIGKSSLKICQIPSEVISVRVTTGDPHTKEYTFQELQELISLIVLITGKNKAENQSGMHRFLELFRKAHLIAEALIAMHQEGYMESIGDCYCYRCSITTVDELNNKANNMDEQLKEWTKLVEDTRHKYYPLNSFTNKQLCQLRRELHALLPCTSDLNALTCEVKFLLSALLPCASDSDIIKALCGSKQQLLSSPTTAMESPSSITSDSLKQAASSSPKNTEQASAEIKELVKSSVLSSSERDNYMNMIEAHNTEPVLTLLAVLKSSDEGNCELADVLETFEILQLQVMNSKLTIFDINKQINRYLSTRSPKMCLKEEMHIPASSDETISSTVEPSKKRPTKTSSSTIDLSLQSVDYLSLEQLGQLLQEFVSGQAKDHIQRQRKFQGIDFETGSPNLIVTENDLVLKCAMMLYAEDKEMPLPTQEEVLICTSQTTAEEVTLLWRRAIGDPGFRRIFCLLHAEKLSYLVSEECVKSLLRLKQEKSDYRLVIICSNEHCHMVENLHAYLRTTLNVQTHNLEQYLISKYCYNPIKYSQHTQLGVPPLESNALKSECAAGWKVDEQSSYVRVVQSNRVGMGKSLYITRKAQELAEKFQVSDPLVTIRVHGPKIAEERIMDQLQSLGTRAKPNDPLIVHIDIAPSMVRAVDCFLFSLLVLGYFTDRRGKLWRRKHSHLYMIEITLQNSANFATNNLLELLPSKKCLAPIGVGITVGEHHLENKKWSSDSYQLVYYYLKHYDTTQETPDRHKKFKDVKTDITRGNRDFLHCIFRHFKAKNPSWRELEHFILFLSAQLSAFEESGFCDTGDMSTSLPGMRKLVMKMILQMSKEFTLPSLRDDDTTMSVAAKQQLEVPTYKWKKWNESFHPYLFFNQDGISFTFVGFYVTENGDAIDPATSRVIMPKIMSTDLRSILRVNKINLSENFRRWKREEQLQKLAAVIGLNPQAIKDPNPSYVLTADNIIKILAIIMRLRCNIPVIIMGETGCGKTQLLRFLCSLIAQAFPFTNSFKNFRSVKVHGGTSEETIIKAVEEAETCAVKNSELLHEVKEKVKKMKEEKEARETKGTKGSLRKNETKYEDECSILYLDGTKLGTVLFFDEANTTDYVDLIKEIMCDHTIHGRKIHKDVRVVAACNPYRKHSSEMIEKLESAGLGFHMKAREMLVSGGIPLRNLVYRVNDLPPSMKSLVYDFGQLSNEAEVKYIKEIVKKHVSRVIYRQRDLLCKTLANILNLSQTFMRETTDECSYVSLRDVDRAMIVFKFFYDKSRTIGREMEKLAVQKKQHFIQCYVTRAVLLALAVCYYARLQEPKKRNEFAVKVSSGFMPLLHLMLSNVFVQHVQWCQEIFLNNMGVIGQNIAHNRALRENVMMMVVCINLRIPLFLIGKPGSSKSLAKTIISNSMRGTAPSNTFLENFKEVQMFSYQCSQLSTSDSILNVFHQAKTIQSNNTDKSKFVSVVVLDEVGLAEDSPNLPLKVLHPLLEDGTEGNSYSVDVVDREDRVAFIGISNWALDPAKMNRGIMVTRCDPDEHELTESAREICSSGTDNDLVAEWLEPCFKYFAKAYLEIVKKQTGKIRKEFFGLRDFYSMVKMLYWMCKEADCHPNKMQIEHVVLRNFSGFDNEGFAPMEIFEKSALSQLSMPPSKDKMVKKWREELHARFIKEDEKVLKPLITKFKEQNAEQLLKEYTSSSDMSEDQFLSKKFKECMKVKKFPDEQTQQRYIAEFKKYFDQKFEGKIWPLIHPDCTPAGLIKASLANKERSYHGENRYLLFLTESYAALQTLQHFFEVNYQRMRVQSSSSSDSSSTTGEQQPPLILFGSSFPKDKHFTQVCRHINTVKICMETGRTVVLLNLEEVYESLYDALNQYYREYGAGTRFVDIGLQSHRIKCSVHNEFKLILIAEKSVVYDRFPTPLINRLEKHIVNTSTVLNERQEKILEKLTQWIEDFNSLDGFQPCDSFIGYQADTPSAVVFTASRENGMTEDQIEQTWESQVFQSCKSLLLEMASPDALIRLGDSSLIEEQKALCKMYMEEQHHSSLEDFVRCQISLPNCTKSVLMQATTHNQLLSTGEIECLESTLSLPERHIHVAVVSCHLQQFDTEYSFTSRVREEYKKLDKGDVLFIVQCDSGHINGDLIACAKYCLEDIQEEFKIYKLEQSDKSTSAGLEEDTCTSAEPAKKSKNHFHVLFTVYLPWKHGDSKSSFISFWGGDWKCTHIDDFFPVHPFSPVLALARGEEQITLSKFFHMIYIEKPSPDTPGARATAQQLQCDSEKEQTDRKLYVHIQQAVEKSGRLPTGIPAARMKKLNETLLRLLRVERNDDFYDILCSHIHAILQKKEDQDGSLMRKWVYEEATNSLNLQSGGAFMKVLLRRLNRDLTDVFSTIIAAIDTNYNLDLLVNGPPCLVQFWIDAFKHRAVSDIWGQDILSPNENKVSAYVHNQNPFFCCFPFSFIFRDSIENQWRIETSNFGKASPDLFSSICSVMQSSLSAIGGLLNTISGNHHIIEMGRLYLMDLISANLPSSLQSQDLQAMETKIVLATLEPEACRLFSEENPTFSQVVVALHIAYHHREDEISRFKELIKVMPSKLKSIKGYDDDKEHSDERTVVWKLNTEAWRSGPDILAVSAILKQLVLESVLEPNQKRLVNLMRYYYRVKHLVDQVLNNARTKENVRELRLEWQKLQVVYKFIEHVILENTSAKNPGAHTLLGFLVPYAKRLIQKFKKHPDFATARTTEILEITLSVMHGDLKKQFRSQLRQIEKSCITFYTDVITSLCFGQAGPPDEKLVEKLLQTVFTASEESEMKTCELTPFMGIPDGGSADEVPVIRSFLLRLLFNDSSKHVRKYIDNFFNEARRACGPDSSTFRGVTLLYCQCFEDSLYQKVASLPGNKRFAYVYEKMKNSFDSIEKYFMAENEPEIDQSFLEAVGSLRFALNFAADCISQKISSDCPESSTVLSWSESNVQDFLILTKKSHLYNTANDHKPRLFLFKLLFRRHGTALVEFCNEIQPKYMWLVSELKGIWKIQLADPFAIYDTYFGSAYAAVKDTLKAKGTCQLEFQKLQLPAEKFGPLLTLIFLSLRCYHFSDLEMTCLEYYINSSEVFTQHLKHVALAIISNSFCGSLPDELQFSETQTLQNRHISTLMVHIVTVVLARQDQPLIQPFVYMTLNTSILKDIWMPVMPDPLHANTSLHLGGIFLECPSKHTCFVHQTVTGLNEPLKEHSCPDCGKTSLLRSAIGRKSDSDDVKGYTLGVPLPYQPSTIRSLSPVAAMVMRVLMHTMLLWTSCNEDDDIKNIQSAIQLNVVEDDSVPRFFYKHLREDLQALGQFLSMNNDDVILLMHLIAKSILDRSPCQTDKCPELLTKDGRNAWEKKFSTEYILPLIQDVTKHIANARIHMFKDEKQDLQLYDLMVKAEKHSLSLTGDLWAFRPRLNLEHISQSLKADGNSQKYALLAYFLKEEPMIRATQYLPSILKLQQYLLSKHHHRSSHEQLKDERIIDIISGAQNDCSMQVKEMIECTRKAWNLVKGRLYTHGFLKLPKECLTETFADEGCVELLLPRPCGLGIYCYALVAHLVYTHNEFIDLCSEIVVTNTSSQWRHTHHWWKQSIYLEDVQPCHLVQYEDKLMSIIMAHCHYSLRAGEDVSYHFDFQGLEKQFLNECVYGKPHIEVKELPHMVYRKDVYTAQKFEEIKRRVHQVSLTSDIKKKIITHVKEPHQLRKALDHIDIVLGFLAASSGVNPLTTVKEYAQDMLKIEEFDELIGSSCRLRHVLSLWKTVSLELAKQLTVNGEDPFHEVKHFHKPLNEHLADKLKASLPHINIGSLLNTLNVFIKTHVRNMSRDEAEEKLVTRLEKMYEEMEEMEEKGDLEKHEFPEELKLCHVVSVWQHVVKYDQELQKTLK